MTSIDALPTEARSVAGRPHHHVIADSAARVNLHAQQQRGWKPVEGREGRPPCQKARTYSLSEIGREPLSIIR